MIGSKKVHNDSFCASCYFRSVAIPPYKKAILQITEKCNMKCKHCFVSSTSLGGEMSLEEIREKALPQLIANNVTKVTLTGGEPLVHRDILKIAELFTSCNIEVSICTNASLITQEFVSEMKQMNSVHFNVSLDGFSHNSHGKFRGNESPLFFQQIINNITLLSEENLLNGILVTPNIYSSVEEYVHIVEFAKEKGAKYVLMNPLSEFGRGEHSINIGYSTDQLLRLQDATSKFCSNGFELVYIRFPNDKKPLGACVAGQLFYVFTDGNVAICPYIVFATKNQNSMYRPDEFIIGNLFDTHFNLHSCMSSYEFPQRPNENGMCIGCSFQGCSKGCIAAKITRGRYISDADEELCPLCNHEGE